MNPVIKYLKNLFASQRVIGGDKELLGKLQADKILQKLIDDRRVPGLAITVRKNNEVYFEKGYGFADVEQHTRIDPQNTIFRIASVSKPIAAAALASMVEEGLLDLDASIYKYVPYFPKKEFNISLRQLAGHTAGIRGYRGGEYGLNKPLGIKESLALFQDDDLLFEPGKGFQYTSFDWVLISLAMQEVSGIPFADYVREKILNSCGLKNTFPENPGHHLPNGTTFYSKGRLGFRKAIPVNNAYKLAGGGYLSTSADIALFGQVYLDPKFREGKIQSQFLTSGIVNGTPTYYGLGWQVTQDKLGRTYYGHVGNGVGGYAVFYVYPEQDMVFSILINCTNPGVLDTLEEVISVFLKDVNSNIPT
ncbi:serine hydrolase domain-containing protein [Arenibacter sp. M-2]|uniref:serine hydrolase domain-containing protein n=1 Tax=Arenibacter sp. M-2 TaxID=3053612 RepID=UPI0025706D0D|nr:serine hydrolase domain-containing protein [Arenibacter sp. M-2]MDL5513648.1 serine hydrolase domain-containing protein [Arenibacter sp. M-2]